MREIIRIEKTDDKIDGYKKEPQYLIFYTRNDACIWSEDKLLKVLNEKYRSLKGIAK